QLGAFRELNARTVAAGLDPDGGEQEDGLMAQLEAQLKDLETAVEKSRTQTDADASVLLRNHPKVREAHGKARRTAEHLRQALIDDIQASGRSSSAAIRQSLWWVGFA